MLQAKKYPSVKLTIQTNKSHMQTKHGLTIFFAIVLLTLYRSMPTFIGFFYCCLVLVPFVIFAVLKILNDSAKAKKNKVLDVIETKTNAQIEKEKLDMDVAEIKEFMKSNEREKFRGEV